MRSLKACLLATILCAMAACGCRGTAEPRKPLVSPEPPPAPQLLLPEDEAGMVLKEVDLMAGPDPVPGTKYFSAPMAKQCPRIRVTTAQEERLELEPGRAGFVTLVVFFAMDLTGAKAAAKHVHDLFMENRHLGVRAVGVVLKTQRAGEVHQFATSQRIEYPIYLDDLSALRKMAEAAGAESRDTVPAVFIIDRQQRLRFYRPGFRFAATALGGTRSDSRTVGPEVIYENVPEGRRIADYLKAILREQ